MHNRETETESFNKIIKGIQNDPLINKRIIQILKMDSYTRRFVLNNWMEQLRRNDAPQDLLNVLSCLFDDKVADQILLIIHKNN